MADIIGGAAIVISLIFVGYQVKQNTKEAELNRRALELTTYQRLIQNFVAIQDPITLDEGMARIYMKSRNSESLSELEKTRLRTFSGATFRHGDLAYFH